MKRRIVLSSIIARNPLVIELESKLEALEIEIASKLIYKTNQHPEIEMLTAKGRKDSLYTYRDRREDNEEPYRVDQSALSEPAYKKRQPQDRRLSR